MIQTGSPLPFSIVNFLEKGILESGQAETLEYRFIVGPFDKKGTVIDGNKEPDPGNHIIAIQVGLERELDRGISNAPVQVVEKIYGIGNIPFPNKETLRKEIYSEAERIDQVLKKADKFVHYVPWKRPGKSHPGL
jgi:hypothetical protein